MFSWSTYFVSEELKKRGYTIESIDDCELFRAVRGSRSFFVHKSKGPGASATANAICRDKYLTRLVLQREGFATPQFVKVSNETIDAVDSLAFPVVVKPLTLSQGKDVVVNVANKEGVQAYFKEKPQHESVLVEEMLRGEDARILIVRGKFFAAVKRIPAFVTGDGVHTITELVEQENQRRATIKESDEKNNTYTTDLDLILFNDDARSFLRSKNVEESFVPGVGVRQFVRGNANTSTGGISVDVTEQVCEGIRFECERFAKLIEAPLIGIDIMTSDLGKPLNALEHSGFVEVNSTPGLDLHVLTDEGQRRDPTPLIVDDMEAYLDKMGL